MAVTITNGYVTSAELKATLSLTGETFADDDIGRAINAASRLIDEHCNRFFYTDTTTRFFTPSVPGRVWTDDIVSVTTLKTDEDGDGTYETTWATGDYYLDPRNNAAMGKPFTSIRVTPQGSYHFPRWDNSVEVAGTFGWSATPPAVIEACRILAHQSLKSTREAPLGVIMSQGFEGNAAAIRVGGRLDPRVATMLAPFRKNYPVMA